VVGRSSSALLDTFCASTPVPIRVAVVVAHPDDEVIGAGGRLPLCADLTIVHVTDGAPRNLSDARRAGAESAHEYAALRRTELETALLIAGRADAAQVTLGVADQASSFHLADITTRLAAALENIQPDIVLSHPYEGGHPDHDAAAFVVQGACALLARAHGTAPARLELTSYHIANGVIETGEFLGPKSRTIRSITLTPEEQSLKRRMLDAFASQRDTLRPFGTERERFSVAPAYDFRVPPHDGRLFYEYFDWGIDGEEWRANAALSLAELGLT
jgi:LmbE family N-acetylglucosaminyl deacetylase